jgi:hypothetical protein
MRYRLTAFGFHLLGSATALLLVLGTLYLGWYRWPGWYLSSVLHVVGIVVLVDLVLGPILTLIVASPGKLRRVLARDIVIIVAVQLVALGYGSITLWGGRPLYYAFSVNSLDMVQASDIEPPELALARRQNPTFVPHWYSLPRWIWAPLPEDADTATSILKGALGGGADVTDMPRYYRSWAEGLPRLRDQLARLDDMKYFNQAEKELLRNRLLQRGLAPNERNALVMWGGTRRVLAIFDPTTLEIRAFIKPG